MISITGYSGGFMYKMDRLSMFVFYMDYQDGDGWGRYGLCWRNVHDIPTQKIVVIKMNPPINYTVRLIITPKRKYSNTQIYHW
jgi:hypothetical protein